MFYYFAGFTKTPANNVVFVLVYTALLFYEPSFEIRDMFTHIMRGIKCKSMTLVTGYDVSEITIEPERMYEYALKW